MTDTITTFKDLFYEISYSYDYSQYDFIKHDDGTYSLNKLYITPTTVSYKTSNWNLAPKVFKQFEEFYEFFQSTKDET